MVNKLKTFLYRTIKANKKRLDFTARNNHQAVEKDLRSTKKLLAELPLSVKPTQGSFLIISLSNLPFLLKAHSLLGHLAQKEGLQPILMTYSGCKWAPKYGALFGLNNILYWNRWMEQGNFDSGKEVIDAFFQKEFGTQDIKNLEYKGVSIGKHAMSTLIRDTMSGRFDISSPEYREKLKKYLQQAISVVEGATALIKEYKVVKMIVRDAGYLPNGAVYETGLNLGVDAIRFENAQMMGQWQVKRYNLRNKGQALFSISPETWETVKKLMLSLTQQQALKNDFEERYNADSKKDLYKYQFNKKLIPSDHIIEQFGLDRQKKTAVVFSHISWDANFFDGEDLFENFEHWLVETIRIAIKNPNLNWIIKLHPANVYKLKRANRTDTEIIESEMVALQALAPLPGHIKIMRSSSAINTWSLFEFIDYGLTVRGTIGAELPCYGVPVVTAGTGRYDRYGFTMDPSTREEYEKVLLELHQYPRLTANEIDKARKHAYWFFLNRTVSFDDISEMISTVSETPNHPLHHNIIFKEDMVTKMQESHQISKFKDWLFNSDKADFIYSKDQ